MPTFDVLRELRKCRSLKTKRSQLKWLSLSVCAVHKGVLSRGAFKQILALLIAAGVPKPGKRGNFDSYFFRFWLTLEDRRVVWAVEKSVVSILKREHEAIECNTCHMCICGCGKTKSDLIEDRWLARFDKEVKQIIKNRAECNPELTEEELSLIELHIRKCRSGKHCNQICNHHYTDILKGTKPSPSIYPDDRYPTWGYHFH